MSKIVTDLSLRDVLIYTRFGLGRERYGTFYFNRPDGGADQLLRLAISGVNKGDFDAYKAGVLRFGSGPSLQALREMDDQEAWLKASLAKAEEGVKEGFPLWFSIDEGPIRRPLAGFYWNDEPSYGPARFSVDQIALGREQNLAEKLRGLLAPFVSEADLDARVGKMVRKAA